MPEIVIADTSCFIVLSKIKQLTLLQSLYTEVATTVAVANEYGELLPDWVKIKSVYNQEVLSKLEKQLDAGEASAIALALETKDSILVLDDLKARKVAMNLKLAYTGTLGVIVKAKKSGFILAVRPLINELDTAGMRLSDEVKMDALKQAGE